MSWIKIIHENEAEGELKKIYDRIKGKRGKVSNIMRIHSLNPKAMQNHLDLYVTLMFAPSGLSRAEREMIGVVVSATNHCRYCISHHAEALHFYWKDSARIDQLITDFRKLDLPSRSKSILEYAVKLTQNPESVSSHDIAELRRHGLSDADILHVNLITSYFNFVNRIVLGLGVEFSDDEVRGYRY